MGVFGHPVKLSSGATIEANEDYVRETITHPGVKIIAGYQPIMPTFKGLVGEEGVQQLIAYIKSLNSENGVTHP